MSNLPPIDLADLRVLVSLAAERHFAKAARACNMSQPALSARIRRMEEAFAAPLVERGQRFVGFTEAGERVLIRARRVLADLDGLRQDVAGGASLTGRLRLGVVPTATPLAGRLAAMLAERYPGIQTMCASLTSRAIEDGLADFTLDAGLTYLGNEPLSQVDTLPLLREAYCLVGPDHLLATADDPVPWDALDQWPLALLTPDMQNRRILDIAFSKAGITPKIAFESNSFLSILSRAGVGAERAQTVAILPRLIVDMLGVAPLAVRPLAPHPSRPRIGLVVPQRQPVPPFAEAIWQVAKEVRDPHDNLT